MRGVNRGVGRGSWVVSDNMARVLSFHMNTASLTDFLVTHDPRLTPRYRVNSHARCCISGAISFSQASWTAAGEPGVEMTTRSR